MDENGPRVADYFVVAGLTEESRPLEEEISSECSRKPTKSLAPIIDVAVIVKSQGEKVPEGFTCVETTPQGFPADLNHGCLGSPSIFLCLKRGFDRPPLTDLGILYEGKERVMHGCEIVSTTPSGYPANVNNRIGVGSQRAYISFRRASDTAPHNSLAVIDICVILMNKGETPPHAFCLINKNLNKGSMVGSDVFLCYKKSAVRGNSLAYQAGTLSRYPLGDHEDFAYPESVPRFCMPMGAAVETWLPDRTHPLPVFSTFVLTDSSGDKVYGAAVSFYESYPEDKLTPQQKKDLRLTSENKNGSPKKTPAYSVHTNKCVCLLSHWPFFDAFKKFLSFIYRISISGPHTIPIERHISHFMHDVPFPTPQRPRIMMELGHESLLLAQPQTSPIPQNGASFCAMLRYLGPENSMNLLTFVLLEHKILLHSLRMALLTGVAEAVASMIFPFVWQCPYIPLCPLSLSDVLSAPLPVITGVDSRFFDMCEPPPDATCVDIDTNTILQSEEKKIVTWKILPKKPAKRLHSTLYKLYVELCQSAMGDGVSDDLAVEIAPLDNDFTRKKKQITMEFRIQEAFLTFMSTMLKGYNQYLLPITQQPNHRVTDASARFDAPGFTKTRDKTSHPFFKHFLKTQMFITFIEERSFVTENDDKFAFFDDCTDKIDLESKEEVRLIDFEGEQGSDHTVFVMPPDPAGMTEGAYSYTTFPILKHELFHPAHLSVMNTPGGLNRSMRSTIPSSPLTRRSKHEIRVSQKLAKKTAESPERWAEYLLSQAFALWFLHLPSYVKATHSKTRALRTAFEVLKKMQSKDLETPDEACYRVLMQLCGQYSQPVLAVQTFMEMKHCGIKPNAITYGFYNKAVMESTWPTTSFSGYQQWVKLRNTLLAVALFRRGLNNRRSYSDTSSNEVDMGSRSSGDSGSSDALPGSALIQLMEHHPSGLTREEKCSTGNSDMGYSSMIMDESAPNDIASPELSPIRSRREEGGEDNPDVPHEENGTIFKTEDVESNDKSRENNETLVDLGPSSATSTPENIKPNGDAIRPAADEPANKSIVRTSASSEGTSPSNGCIEADSLTTGKTLEEMFFESLSPPSDAARRRHRSTGDRTSWTIHQSLRKRNTSGGSGSASPVAMLLESDPEMAKDIFGSDVKILQTLTHSPLNHSRTSQNNFHCGRTEEESKEETVHQRSRSLGSKPHFWDLKTGEGGTDPVSQKELVSLCDQIKAFSAEEPEQDVQSDDEIKANDSLISFDEKEERTPRNSLETDSLTKTISDSSERTNGDSTANGDINDDFLFKVPEAPLLKCNGDIVHTSKHEEDIQEEDEEEEYKKSTAEVTVSSEDLDKTDQDSTDIENDTSSPIFQKGANKQSPEPSKTRTPKIQKTPQRNSFLASVLTSPFSPRFSKPAFNKTLSMASSQMENVGASFRARATDLASKFGEYTRTLSNPGTPRSATGAKPITGSLIDLESADQQDLPDLASSWNDRFLDSSSMDDLGIMMPLSLAGSSQSLNQPGQDQEDFSFRRQCALEVNITSCYQCDSCESTLYDETIMAGWSADDSNLNTSCCFCNSQLVPFLTVDIRDFRESVAPHMTTSPSSESMQSINSAPGPLLKRMDSNPLPISADPNSTGQSVSSMDNLSVASDSDLLNGPPLGAEGTVKDKTERDPSASVGEADLKEDLKKLDLMASTKRRRSTSECNTTELGQKSLTKMDRPSVPVNGAYCVNRRVTLPRVNQGLQDVPDTGPVGGSQKSLRSMTLPRIRAIDEGSCSSLPSSVRGSREHLPPPRRDRDPEPISVPYLSPLVLRKEVENVIENEGEVCLRSQEFVTQHPIIFWNLVWYFRRLDIPNYLPGVLLAAYSENRDGPDSGTFLPKDTRYVKINVLWDNMKLYEGIGLPMYVLWSSHGSALQQTLMSEHQAFSKQFMLSIVKCIRYNNVLTPITMLLDEYKKRYGDTHLKRHSIYRELVYLTFMSLGRDNIDHDAFDKEYRQAYNRLSDEQKDLLRPEDKPPNRATMMCRRLFNDLYLSYFK